MVRYYFKGVTVVGPRAASRFDQACRHDGTAMGDWWGHSRLGTRSGKAAFLTVPRGVSGIGFPEICSQLLFPEIGLEVGKREWSG